MRHRTCFIPAIVAMAMLGHTFGAEACCKRRHCRPAPPNPPPTHTGNCPPAGVLLPKLSLRMIDQGNNNWAWITYNGYDQPVDVLLSGATFVNGSYQGQYCFGYQRVEPGGYAGIYPTSPWNPNTATGTSYSIWDSRFSTGVARR